MTVFLKARDDACRPKRDCRPNKHAMIIALIILLLANIKFRK